VLLVKLIEPPCTERYGGVRGRKFLCTEIFSPTRLEIVF